MPRSRRRRSTRTCRSTRCAMSTPHLTRGRGERDAFAGAVSTVRADRSIESTKQQSGVSVTVSKRGSAKATTEAPPLGPTGRPYQGFPTPRPLDAHGPAKIISLCNQKGGVGKTTSTINLAAALANYGRKVLAVDFDPQGALSAGLGIQTHDVPTIYDLLIDGKRDPHDAIVPTAIEGLDLMPANIDLSAAEV